MTKETKFATGGTISSEALKSWFNSTDFCVLNSYLLHKIDKSFKKAEKEGKIIITLPLKEEK